MRKQQLQRRCAVAPRLTHSPLTPTQINRIGPRGRQAKVGPRGKMGHPIRANLVNAMAKIMILISNPPPREGTMEYVV